MSTVYKYNDMLLNLITTDDFNLGVTAAYDITALTLKFLVKKPDNTIVDWSTHLVKTGATTFNIAVPSSAITTLGAMDATYEVNVTLGAGSKDYLFGGKLRITEGIQ
jgi:hypothetical protein